jgi:choline dehydrogenase-like flavoprotein
VRRHWIVVGAGSGGCVAAARLAEDPARPVTLLEAGGPVVADPTSSTFAGLTASRGPGVPPRTYLAGRGLGGSSAINGMLARRGDAAQYARWGWSDVTDAWARVAIPAELPSDDELGPLDRALLRAEPDARTIPLTRRDGRRVTSADAYLGDRSARPGLEVRTGSVVDRVLLDGRRAVGVRLVDGSELAADHVVVAAGALHTPAVLLRSGVDTPGIGTGLQDHPSAAITIELREGVRVEPDGLLVATALDRDDLQVLPLNHVGGRYAALACALMRPRGRAGRVALAADPSAEPVVDLALFADRRDLTRLRDGIRWTLDLLDRPAFRELAAGCFVDDHGTPAEALGDDDAIERWLLAAPPVHYHATSTCAIGSVLDDDGAVRGYEGLYVCDASAFPSVPATNPHLPTTMLAERLAARWRRASISP